MKQQRAKILIVENDDSVRRALHQLVASQSRWAVKSAENGRLGLAVAREFGPDLVLSDYDMPEMDGMEFCQQIKKDPSIETPLFVMLTAFADTPLKVRGLQRGADDYLTKPVEATELLAKLDAMLRIKNLHDELRREKQALQRTQEQLARSLDQLIAVLVYVLDRAVPGAGARGERLAEWAALVAERFGVPERFVEGLRHAARLQEIGRVVQADRADGMSPVAHVPADWTYVLASRSILHRVNRLEDAGDLVAQMYENWDGTGLPDRRCKGEIPLRARILRVLVDLFRILEHGGPETTPAGALDELRPHAGMRYDPLVIQHLGIVIGGNPDLPFINTKLRLAARDLSAGMVLAENLHSASGVLLLAEGSTLTPRILDLLQERDQADPMVEGAWVLR